MRAIDVGNFYLAHLPTGTDLCTSIERCRNHKKMPSRLIAASWLSLRRLRKRWFLRRASPEHRVLNACNLMFDGLVWTEICPNDENKRKWHLCRTGVVCTLSECNECTFGHTLYAQKLFKRFEKRNSKTQYFVFPSAVAFVWWECRQICSDHQRQCSAFVVRSMPEQDSQLVEMTSGANKTK